MDGRRMDLRALIALSPLVSQMLIWSIFSMCWLPLGIELYSILSLCGWPITIAHRPLSLFHKSERALHLLGLHVEWISNNHHPYSDRSHDYNGSKEIPTIGSEVQSRALICLGKFSGFLKGLHSFCPLAYLTLWKAFFFSLFYLEYSGRMT